jgi:hypothetical protein
MAVHKLIGQAKATGDIREAHQLAATAAEAAAALTTLRRADILGAAARCLATIGQGGPARMAAAAMPHAHRRTVVLTEVATILAAGSHIQAAIDAARAIDDPVVRCKSLTHITRDLHMAGKSEHAIYAATQASDAGDAVPHQVERCDALMRLANVLHATGMSEQALGVADRLLLIGATAWPPKERCRVLRELAAMQNRLGNHEGAFKAAQHAVNAARAISDPEQQAATLAELTKPNEGADHSPGGNATALELLLLTPTAASHLGLFPVNLLARLVSSGELA